MWKHKNFINLQLCAGETWVLNETVDIPTQSFTVDFVSNGQNFKTIKKVGTQIYYDNVQVYVKFTPEGIHWASGEAYRALTFATASTGDLLTWLQANATKQSPQPTLTFKHFYDAGTIGSGTYKFRHYSQQEPSSGETWVLNENAYKPTNNFTYTANFVCDGTNYTTIVNSNNPMTGGLFYDTTQVVHPDYASQFVNEKYRTITFATPPTGDLLTWLQANGTKQGGVTLINFTIDGTTYQAEEGMTWQEWVNSSYNTYGCTIEGSSVKGKGNNGSPTYIYINQNLNLTLVSSTDSIIKNATYEDAAGGAGN